MNKRTSLVVLLTALLVLSTPLFVLATMKNHRLLTQGNAKETQSGIMRITGPYVHNNLAIFLLHGKDKTSGRSVLTLQEALKQKKIIIYETKDVNELAIENLSADEEVYVQSGEIVKGGQQDRMLGVDLIVPPKSGRMPIAAFCVEHGRWNARGSESAGRFSSSDAAVPNKEMLMAAKRAGSQSEVWKQVSAEQDKLSASLGAAVRSSTSSSSLQLTLENRTVQETAAAYTAALAHIVDKGDDLIGYACAINGQIKSADVYVSSALFKRLWPKLLNSNAIEAIAELQKDKKFGAPPTAMIRAFVAEPDEAVLSEKDVTKRIKVITRENPRMIQFETRDSARKEGWIHKNYMTK